MRKTSLIASALAAGLAAVALASGAANAKVDASRKGNAPTIAIKAQQRSNPTTIAQQFRCTWGCQEWDRYGRCVRWGQVCR